MPQHSAAIASEFVPAAGPAVRRLAELGRPVPGRWLAILRGALAVLRGTLAVLRRLARLRLPDAGFVRLRRRKMVPDRTVRPWSPNPPDAHDVPLVVMASLYWLVGQVLPMRNPM